MKKRGILFTGMIIAFSATTLTLSSCSKEECEGVYRVTPEMDAVTDEGVTSE